MTAVAVRDLTRSFGSTTALDQARFQARAGEVHGLLGENGAGKTTLLNILAGVLQPDAGEVVVGGTPVTVGSPARARELGIGMVHQHFALVPRLTVLENLMLGWPGSPFSLPVGEVRPRARSLADETGLDVPLDAPVESLGVGERQRVEILKVLLQDPEVLILDEPTAVLSPPEVDGLLGLIGRLATRGTAVILVAHKLDEVLAVADRVTVLRRGATVLEAPRTEVDAGALARAMVGQDSAEGLVHVREAAATRGGSMDAGPAVASLTDVTLPGPRGQRRLDRISLEVRRGEIVGIAGVEGNGQRELALVLAGIRAPDEGRAEVPGDTAFIPQDRRSEGLIQEFTLTENLALRLRRRDGFHRGPLVNWGALRRRTREVMESYDIRASGPEARAASLSGGNQQRVVLARELDDAPSLVVAENPTRGLDVAGEAFVHDALRQLRDTGETGVALLSTDLDEILALADRLFVMVRGRLDAVEPGPELRERIGQAMLGADDTGGQS